jgi:dTDP-4-amino-4,6-dideoxygalactose transaminase
MPEDQTQSAGVAASPSCRSPCPTSEEEEIAAVVACLRSGWVTTGPVTRQFEQDFAAYLGGGPMAGHCAIAVNSATAGLHLALESAGHRPRRRSHRADAHLHRHRRGGALPGRPAGIRRRRSRTRINLSAAAAEAALTPRTRAIIPVHYAGLACDMDALLALARRHGLRVVEDAAHAFPTR